MLTPRGTGNPRHPREPQEDENSTRAGTSMAPIPIRLVEIHVCLEAGIDCWGSSPIPAMSFDKSML